ncbi:agmatinase family protein [Wenyingzhuangia sp. IMCC45574]
MDNNSFNPSGVGLNNGHFIGLPFSKEEANVVVVSVPWDVTVSYNDGTSNGPQNVLEASTQLDLAVYGIKEAWKLGIYLQPSDAILLEQNKNLRAKSEAYIAFLEHGGSVANNAAMQSVLNEVNSACQELKEYVYTQSKALLTLGKIPAVLGGEHSCPLGLLQALKEKYGDFGVLQVDAHMDLRTAYEGFTYSHASIFNNAINKRFISKLVQVGIRDYCDEEVAFAKEHEVSVFYDHQLKSEQFVGTTWKNQCDTILENLPELVYISFDIDGLVPSLCPETGTPVPGGLEFTQAMYLIEQVAKSGRKIIGFDLCEVGGSQAWDGNVGARVLYCLCNWAGYSQGLLH